MPEVLEVKVYADFMTSHVVNKNVNSISNSGKVVFKRNNNVNDINNVVSVNTKGKYIYMKLNNGYYIGSSLGLVGGWFFKDINNIIIHPDTKYFPENIQNHRVNCDKYVVFEMKFDDGVLCYYDKLKFGKINIFESEKLLLNKLNKIGCDIMQSTTTLDVFIKKITCKTNINKIIVNVLLDQRYISGIGNYLRSEALWLAKINPLRIVNSLNNIELTSLYHALIYLTSNRYQSFVVSDNNFIKDSNTLSSLNSKDYYIKDPNIHSSFNHTDRFADLTDVLLKHKRSYFVYDSVKDVFDCDVKVDEVMFLGNKRKIYWNPVVQV